MRLCGLLNGQVGPSGSLTRAISRVSVITHGAERLFLKTLRGVAEFSRWHGINGTNNTKIRGVGIHENSGLYPLGRDSRDARRLPARFTNNTAYRLGLQIGNTAKWQLACSYQQRSKSTSPGNTGSGLFADYINCGLMGVAVASVLARTGRDNAILKGIGVASLPGWLCTGSPRLG